MILAAPLVIPFAKAVGLSVGTLGMAALVDQVNDYIKANPEESAMILKTLVPNLGIGEIFMKKGKDEEVEEEVDIEDMDPRDLTDAEKRKIMRDTAKSGGDVREKMKEAYEKFIKPGQDRTFEEAEERYEGGLEDVKKPPFDYKRFFRKADGGAIGVDSLFEEKKPRKKFQEGGYEPLFTEDVETFTAPIGLNTVNVPSRINQAYIDATNEAFRIGNVANRTGLVNPESIMKVSKMPMAMRTLSDINRMDPSSNVIADKYKKQGLSSDYRHTLGTSAFKDSIIDYLGSNLGIDKQSGILDTIGSLAAKGATVFEEGKDAISSLKQYYKDKERVGEKNPELFNLKLSEILAQPIEDFEANFFAADQIPFGTSPLKKMEMIQAYRKFGMDNYMQQLENQKKAAMQEQIKKAEIEAQKRKIATTPGRKTGSGGREVATGAGAVAGAQQDISNYQSFGEVPLADGGRVGFNVGGITDPQALAIYNSMNAYGFSDKEIADTITAQGYDAGTLGQGPSIPTPPTLPVKPEPGEGIIGIDLQERGGGFNPFGPLQSTFTRDLTDVDMYKGVNVEGLTPVQQMNKYRTATQDNMFGLGRFFQPKIRGTLGNRLQRQFQTGQKLPSPLAKIAGAQSPFNIDSKNYNPDFVDQLNYLELGDGLIGMSSVGLKYGPESVLFGKNVISGFGTNNYQKALEKFIAKTKSDKRKKQGEIELQNFLNAEKARKEREAKEQLEIQRAATREADRRAGAFDDRVRLDPGGGGTFKEQTAAKERQGVQVAGPGFGKGAYFAEGGLASMFVEKR